MTRWRALALLVRFAFRADATRAVALLVITVLEMGAQGSLSLWLKFLADGAVAQDGTLALLGGAGMVAAVITHQVGNYFHNSIQETLRDKTTLEMELELMELSGLVPSIEHHERPDYARELELLHGQRDALSSVVPALAWNLGTVIRAVVVVGLFISVHPALGLLPVFAIPALVISGRVQRMRDETWDRTAEASRTADHLFRAASEKDGAMEIRVFGLGAELRRRHREARAWMTREHDRTNMKAAILGVVGWLVFALGYGVAVVFVVWRAARGLATAGDVLLAVSLAAQLSGQISGAAGTVGFLQQSLKTGERYLWLSDYSRGARPPVEGTAPVPQRLRDGIRFEGVSFTYPGTEERVLSDVDLHLPAGGTVALVGDNGAGKTTLVKLLLRFYEPTSGRITVEGTDLGRLEPDEWRRATSAGFQDFVRFEFLARETVGVGELSRLEDEEAVRSALGRASADEVLDVLPEGLGTQLGRRFDDGQELSTGQWQKLALGRAMMREVPLLLVLDEPTASLDPMTEHALFERYAGAAERIGAERGSITLLVSHRFSTVRMADLIVVVDGGRVEEVGSHQELTARGGLYAELYEIQARAYR